MRSESTYSAIRRKMAASLLLVALAPLFLMSGFILRQFSHSYREKTHAHLREVVQKHCQNIDTFLDEQLNIILYVAASHTFEQLCDEPFLRRQLARLQQQFAGVFEDMGIVEETGLQVAYAGPLELLKANYSEAEWFQSAVRQETFISDVFLGLRGRPHFIVAVRRTEDGGRKWLLRATVDFKAFNSLVENLRIGKTGMAFILNRENEFQTRPAGSFPVQRAVYSRLMTGRTQPDDGVRIIEDVRDAGGNYIFAGSTLKNGDWLLVCRQNTTDTYRDLHVAEKIAVLILVAGCCGIIVTAWLISGRMASRISEADREVDLMNRQMVETGKLAAIGELAAGIAHEINNPVAIMMEKAGWMQDLIEEEDSNALKNIEEFNLSLEEIRGQARRCKDITHKLLSFARKTESGAQTVQMNSLLEDIVSFSCQRARYSGVVFQKSFQDDLPELVVSPAEMQQVFLNLINNAMDAMEKTGGGIDIVTTADNRHVTVEISDNGPGIPEPDLARIFEPFFTTKPVGKGTGLGLSICHGIISKSGGQIEVESEVGHGTTFRVRIPIRARASERATKK